MEEGIQASADNISSNFLFPAELDRWSFLFFIVSFLHAS